MFERHREEVTKRLVFERFQSEIYALAQEIAEKGLKDLKFQYSEMEAKASFYEEEAKKLSLELAKVCKEKSRMEVSLKDLEHDRQLLFDANRTLRNKMEESSNWHTDAVGKVEKV